MTLACLDSLKHQVYRDYRVVLCDDGSTDGTSQSIQQRFPDVIVLHGDGNLWWTGATNLCIEHVLHNARSGDHVLTLNNDLEVPSNYLATLAAAAAKYPRAVIGSACADIKTRNMAFAGSRHSWLTAKATPVLPIRDHLPDDPDTVSVTHLPGRGTLIPVDVFSAIGLYDGKHLPQYGADFDFSFRARRAGYRPLVSLRSIVYSHVEETGMTTVCESLSWSSFFRYLTDRKSPANLRARWWLAYKNCPRLWLPFYVLIDMGMIVGSYLKRCVRKSIGPTESSRP